MATQPLNEVTQVLADLKAGDRDAASRLFPLVYEELRALARRKMARERGGLTLQPTALVHEAYLRLVGDDQSDWENRAHFFAAAATAMRRILVERARHHARLKRGGDRAQTPISQAVLVADNKPVDLIDLDNALSKLELIDEQKSAIVTMRYLLGCTVEETARSLGISPAKVKKDWTFARAWLHRQLQGV